MAYARRSSARRKTPSRRVSRGARSGARSRRAPARKPGTRRSATRRSGSSARTVRIVLVTEPSNNIARPVFATPEVATPKRARF